MTRINQVSVRIRGWSALNALCRGSDHSSYSGRIWVGDTLRPSQEPSLDVVFLWEMARPLFGAIVGGAWGASGPRWCDIWAKNDMTSGRPGLLCWCLVDGIAFIVIERQHFHIIRLVKVRRSNRPTREPVDDALVDLGPVVVGIAVIVIERRPPHIGRLEKVRRSNRLTRGLVNNLILIILARLKLGRVKGRHRQAAHLLAMGVVGLTHIDETDRATLSRLGITENDARDASYALLVVAR